MPATSIVGLDTAKNVFQLHGADQVRLSTSRADGGSEEK